MCGAPIVMHTLINAPPEMRAGVAHTVEARSRPRAPPAAVLEAAEKGVSA